jgi:predicted nucleotide-binding protein (sugar kinase/HSP70/actin superfamily)
MDGRDPSPLVSLTTPEDAIHRQLAAERARLRREAGLPDVQHFRRPVERPFLAQERENVTILFGGLTSRHEALIQAVFQGNGYRCERLPTPDAAACQLGREYGNNGQCNPSYFTLGSLIQFLQRLRASGISRQDIIDNYVFFTAGSCGPCRFGMYEAEYRYALQNAGFDGFRILIFQQAAGIKAESGEPGLKFTVNFGMGMLNALHLGDVLNDLVYQVRPFEVRAGETDRVFEEAASDLYCFLRERRPFEFMQDAPEWLRRRVGPRTGLKNTLSVACKVYDHLYGKKYLEALEHCRERLNGIEVDRTIVKPVVKITGEFWAQTTEGDGNFQMFRFLENEGAQVIVEPIGTWVNYMLHLACLQARSKSDALCPDFRWGEIHSWLSHQIQFRRRMMLFDVGEALWTHLYHRLGSKLGGTAHPLVSQQELGRLAHPFLHQLARGGEGYMEVGKNIYYTANRLCHMVLALKPFGCMPSSQSDGVQSAVISRFRDMIFLPIETSGEGEVNAHSRVQMALSDAKVKARAEFETVLKSTGKRLDDIRDYVAAHPELRRPFYRFSHRPGVAGTAAQFVLHVSDLMDQSGRLWRMSHSTSIVRVSP